MRRGMTRLFLVALALTLAACAPSVSTRVYGNHYSARADTAEVQLYSVGLPDCPFEEIALVSVHLKYRVWGSPEGHAFTLIRARARELGGHAVVGLREVQAKPNTGLTDGVQGTVVRFTDANACSPPARSIRAAQ
jgi:hypothetical protein